MNYELLTMLLVVAVSAGAGLAEAATYYVDYAATGAQDGTSWANAYTTIQAAFDNRDLAPGDIVEVAEGTYYETVIPGVNDSGDSVNQVILRVSPDNIVNIDGENIRYHAFNLDYVSHFTLDGFNIDNHIYYSIKNGGFRTGNIIRNCTINIDLTGGSSPDHRGAIVNSNAANSRDFDGQITEVAVWNTVISATDIEILYKSRIKGMPLQIKPANLVGYRPLHEYSDGTSGDGKTFIDRSGNGNNGTGVDGDNDSGLTCKAEEVLSYPE